MGVFTSRSDMQEESKIGWGILQVTMKETPYIFVAFKGTSDCQDLVCDFKWSKQINAELQTECHNGINEIFVKSHLQETVLEELRRIHNTMNDEQKLKAKIIITGHSLGGGAGQILGAYLKRNFLTNDYIRKLIEKADKNHPNHSYVGMLHPNRVRIWCRESKIYSIASPQVFTDIRVGNDSECDWVNQLESSSFHYVNQHDPVVEFNILNGRDQLQPENNEEAYKWIEYGEIYYWTNKNKKFGKINFEDLEKMSKTKTELVVKGIWNTKYHFMRTYLTHFAMQEIDGYEMIDNLNDDTFPKIVIASVCTVGFCCFLGAIFIICFACAGCSTKAKHKPQPRKNVDTEIILQP